MTDDRSFERAARSWLEAGPTEAPDHAVEAALLQIQTTNQERDWHVPWRTRPMTQMTRLLAGAAAIAVVLVGGVLLLRPGSNSGIGGPTPSVTASPSATPSASASNSASAAVALTETFTSARHGFSVHYPLGWTVKDATKPWSFFGTNSWGSGINDELNSATQRFSGASQALAVGQTADQWMTAYANGGPTSSWQPVTVGGQAGKITYDGGPAAGGTISPGGVMYDAVVVSRGRAYNFNMDGKVDRPTFEGFLATVTFDPSSANDQKPPDLTGRFVSPWYGYAIATGAGWPTTPATKHWTGTDNSGPAVDQINVTGTDTTIAIASQKLPAGTTYDQWVAAYHGAVSKAVPSGCDGGDPSTWKTTPIGPQTGRYYVLCNAAEAIVQVGGRVYIFTWGNSTFGAGQHLPFESFRPMLATVTFDPTAAVD